MNNLITIEGVKKTIFGAGALEQIRYLLTDRGTPSQGFDRKLSLS
jgi:hypothetical protein